MKARVEFSKVGFRDLLATTRNWQEHHPARANAFEEEFTGALELLMQFPESAPLATLRRNKGLRLRVLVETGHLVLYRYTKKTQVILVLAVSATRATAQRP
jgi:plasmid stabilization system protein ParE